MNGIGDIECSLPPGPAASIRMKPGMLAIAGRSLTASCSFSLDEMRLLIPAEIAEGGAPTLAAAIRELVAT